MKLTDSWNYFENDPEYVQVLIDRLKQSVAMDSAVALGQAMAARFEGDLSVLDFGSGPGHYFPILRQLYDRGALRYHGIDIVAAGVEAGNAHFSENPAVHFDVGSVLEPAASWEGEDCIISANTLPHVPTIEPLLSFMRDTPGVTRFAFRMLIGSECVEIRKHLSDDSFTGLFQENYQHNNIYSESYLRHVLGDGWELAVSADSFDVQRLRSHSIPAEKNDPFYSNRVSQERAGMIFKGDVYMPWKIVTGQRIA